MSPVTMPADRFLDDEERELESLDRSTAYPKEVQESILAPFRATSKRAVTMRLSESTIIGLKAKAEEEGIPYQTLASIVLEKYVKGAFLDLQTAKKMVAMLRGGGVQPSGKGSAKGSRPAAKTKAKKIR